LPRIRKHVQQAIAQHRDAILQRWRSLLPRNDEPFSLFSAPYIDAALAFVAQSDVDQLHLSLRALTTVDAPDASRLVPAQEVLFRFKQAVVEVLLARRRWRVAEIVGLHAILDEILRISLQSCTGTFAAELETASGPLRTAAQHTEERLRAQEELLAAVVGNCADAIITVDTEGHIQSWNTGAEQIFGYARDEIIGKPFTVLMLQELIDRGEYEFLQQQTRTQGAVRDFETERVTKDGKRLRVAVTRTALHDRFGNWIGTSAIVRDITERKAFETQLAHADRLATMGTMAAGLAHEIGNPLAAISSLVQVLQRRVADPDLLGRLDLVRQQVSRITTIVREMADFSRPGGQSESPAHVGVAVQHAVTLARYSRSTRRVDVRVDLDPNIPPLPMESERLLQVFLNLVLNAYDAMDGEGTLHIGGIWADPMVRVSFCDTGPGVPPALRERIFEPFFTTKPSGKGTGMGLSVSQRIIHAHGGHVTLAEAPSGGAVFTVALPVR
jgi:PAS domain S-box-containing protein